MDTEAFAAPDTQAPAVKPEYHTTNQLQALVATATGKPCKSRNRPALLKKLGMAAEGKASRRVNGKRPGKPKPNKASAIIKALPDKAKRAKFTKPKATKISVTATVRAPVDLRAVALKAVTAAMSRKNPPSLRALCAELADRKIQRPRGGLKWLPSSVQSLMRQGGKGK